MPWIYSGLDLYFHAKLKTTTMISRDEALILLDKYIANENMNAIVCQRSCYVTLAGS
jgi:predicted hydrolase (HD superfamily)